VLGIASELGIPVIDVDSEFSIVWRPARGLPVLLPRLHGRAVTDFVAETIMRPLSSSITRAR
jgi:hypothetical protein